MFSQRFIEPASAGLSRAMAVIRSKNGRGRMWGKMSSFGSVIRVHHARPLLDTCADERIIAST
jgi:hypothetical protein